MILSESEGTRSSNARYTAYTRKQLKVLTHCLLLLPKAHYDIPVHIICILHGLFQMFHRSNIQGYP